MHTMKRGEWKALFWRANRDSRKNALESQFRKIQGLTNCFHFLKLITKCCADCLLRFSRMGAQLRNSRGCGCSLSPMYPSMRGLLGKERRKPTLLREQVEQSQGSIARNLKRPMHAKWKPPCIFRSIESLKIINLHTHTRIHRLPCLPPFLFSISICLPLFSPILPSLL